jgi:UDP-N-acetylglucosamine 2-epimerase (non-hydrolysing)
MKPIHLLFIFGTRPEAIKLAPVVLEARRNARFSVSVCATGQHREMILPILNFFQIKPDFELDVMIPGQTLTELSANLLHKLSDLFVQLKRKHQMPDWILVQGDTTTAMVAALAGFYEKIKIGHVEAGLRTDTIQSPWPEELNRRTIGLIADLHFAPTPVAMNNLTREGKDVKSISMTGNTGIDALKMVNRSILTTEDVREKFSKKFSYLDPARRLILATVHRRENFGQSMEDIFRALLELSQKDNVEILLPVHMNPQVRVCVHEVFGAKASWISEHSAQRGSRIWLCEPLEYLDFVYLMQRSYLIVSDSGGVQEEAPSLGKPVLVVRESTERPEAVTAGANILVGTKREEILRQATNLLDEKDLYSKFAQVRDVYGDGRASEHILAQISKLYPLEGTN